MKVRRVKRDFMNKQLFYNVFLLLACAVMLGGCAGSKAFKAGQDLYLQGRYDEAVAEYSKALSHRPESRDYRLNWIKSKGKAAWVHLDKGRALFEKEKYSEALNEFRLAQALDPSLEVVSQEVEKTERLVQALALIADAEELYKSRRLSQAKNLLNQALEISPGNPKALSLLEEVRQHRVTMIDGFELDVASDKPITLVFRDTKLREVFTILTQLSGVNFIFDEDLRDKNISIMLEKGTFSQALELLLKMNDLEKKVLNSKTIILFANTKDKVKQYEDQVIQTFYLSNIDAKKAVNLLRTMLQLRKIYVHEELNALVVRDKPQVIKLAQQIIEAADRADSEVVFDLELVEVTHTKDMDIGPKLSNYSTSVGWANNGAAAILSDVLASGSQIGATTTGSTPTTLGSTLVQSLNDLQTFYTLPTVTYDFKKAQTDAEILANPRIRVKNKEKAKVHIGSREPVISVTINGDQTSENIQYVDVGVKLDVEPSIQLDNTVVTKLNLEVSSSTRLAELSSGTVPLLINTTNATTALILKDGEQTVIGGLLRDESSEENTSFPFLGDIPFFGKLFSSIANKSTKREILLSITPHIVRKLEMPLPDVASIWSGGEDDLKAGPNFGSFAFFEPEMEEAPVEAAPALRPGPGVTGVVKGPGSQPSAVGLPVAAVPVLPAPGPADIDSASPSPTVLAVPVPSAAPRAQSQPEAVRQVTIPSSPVSPPGEGGRLYFSGPSLVNVGDEFSLEVMVDEVSGLYSAPMFVSFDPDLLEFVRAEESAFLKQGDQATVFTASTDQIKGQMIVGHKQSLGGGGATGSGSLFRLVFRAEKAGKGNLQFERVNFRNPAGRRIRPESAGFDIEVR